MDETASGELTGGVEVHTDGDQVTGGVLLDGAEAEFGWLRVGEAPRRSRWGALASDRSEVVCFGEAGGAFRWRLSVGRRGVWSGVWLSRSRDAAQAEAWASQQEGRWTLGTLGREGLEAPRFEADGDTRTVFFRAAEPWPRLRLLIDDADGELWGTMEPRADGVGWAVRRWDGRALCGLRLEASDETGVVFGVEVGEGVVDGLELAVVEGVGVAAVMVRGM